MQESPEAFGNPFRPPQYAEEVELLLGTTAFVDETREQMLYEDFAGLDEELLGVRSILYTQALRTVANVRSEDRKLVRAREPDLSTAAWNAEWKLTPKRLLQIAQSHKAELDPIRRQLRLRNNILDWVETEADNGLYDHQQPYIKSVVTFLQNGARTGRQQQGPTAQERLDGAVVVAPTGLGKTTLMGATLKGLRISEHGRALVILPSVQLVEQFIGKTGDDTFRRFLGSKNVGGFYAEEKNKEAMVVATTIESFIQSFRDGLLDGTEAFDICLVDEAHQLTEPLFRQTVYDHWQGPIIGFTATPAYSEDKDVRSILTEVINHGDILDYMEMGVLNGAQLLLFRIAPEDYAAQLPASTDLTDLAVRSAVSRELLTDGVMDLLLPLLKEGRRGMVFCEDGSESLAAWQLAERINALVNADGSPILLPDGKPLRAETISSYRRRRLHGMSNREVIDAYHNGEVHVLTTTDTGKQGLNADIDFVVINCNTGSPLRLTQIIGRGTRPSERFPTTLYAQFYAASVANRERVYTLFEAFGLETVTQGVRIGHNARSDRAFNTKLLPPHLRQAIQKIHGKPLSEASLGLGQETVIPDDYIALIELIEGTVYTPKRAVRELMRMGYTWKGRLETIDDQRQFIRYYEPAARALFETKAAHFSDENAITVAALAEEHNVGTTFMKTVVARFQKTGRIALVRGIADSGRWSDLVTGPSRRVIADYINSIPSAELGDISIPNLSTELDIADSTLRPLLKELALETTYKRLVESTGFGNLLAKADADLVRQKIGSIPAALPTDLHRLAITTLVGDAKLLPQLLDMMRRQGIPSGTPKRGPNGRIIEYWDREAGAELARQFKAWIESRRTTLPAHLLPVPAIAYALDRNEGTVRSIGKRAGWEMTPVGLRHSPTTNCYGWDRLQELLTRQVSRPQYKLELRPDIAPIDFSRLPRDEHDTDPDRIAYARALQVLFIGSEERLGLEPDELARAKALAETLRVVPPTD